MQAAHGKFVANLSQQPAERQRPKQAKEEATTTVRCAKPHPGEESYLKQSVGTEAQPRAQHAAAQQRCEGQSVLTVRCKALEGATPEAERTIMAGMADQEIATRVERDVPSLHENPERKERLEGGATVGAACATTVGLTGKLLSMAERSVDQSQSDDHPTQEVSLDMACADRAVSQAPLFNSEGGPDSAPDEGFSMLASEEEENAEHKVPDGGNRRMERQGSQQLPPQREHAAARGTPEMLFTEQMRGKQEIVAGKKAAESATGQAPSPEGTEDEETIHVHVQWIRGDQWGAGQHPAAYLPQGRMHGEGRELAQERRADNSTARRTRESTRHQERCRRA